MIAAVLFVLAVAATNAALLIFGIVPVGFGLYAPAGVYLAGLTFTIRDFIPRRGLVLGAIAVGVAIVALFSGPLALASGAAFATSELLDFAVYERLRRRRWLAAVAASNVVGAVIDSAVFLWLAFGSFEFLAGNVVGKLWVTLVAVVVLAVGRQVLELRRIESRA